MNYSAARFLNRTLRAGAVALVLASLGPLTAHAGEPRREIVFIDDFIRDPVLRSGDWAVNGPAAASTLTRLPGARGAKLASADMSFDSRRGLGFSARGAGGEQSGIQTQYAYTPPFRLTAVGTAVSVGPGTLEVALATADAGAGVGMVGGQGVAPGATGFAMVVAAGPGQPWRTPSDQAWLSRDAPAAGKLYEFVIDVDPGGLAHVYVRSAGQVVGAGEVQVGSGPFYVVLGQAAGANAAGQPSLAHWRGVTISRSSR
jgi:hypothetical protein